MNSRFGLLLITILYISKQIVQLAQILLFKRYVVMSKHEDSKARRWVLANDG